MKKSKEVAEGDEMAVAALEAHDTGSEVAPGDPIAEAIAGIPGVESMSKADIVAIAKQAVAEALAVKGPEWTEADEAYWKQCQKDGKLAQLDAEGNWEGEPDWPIFLGYPHHPAYGTFKYPVRRIGISPETHCEVFVRTDLG